MAGLLRRQTAGPRWRSIDTRPPRWIRSSAP